MQDPARAIETLRGKIEDGRRGGSEEDREALLEFSNELKLRGKEYSDHRHEKLLRHNTRIAEEVGGLADALDERPAAEDIVLWINDEYENEETNRDYRVALRVFGRKMVDNGGDPPDSIEWVPSGTSKTYDPAPEPQNMLRWDDDVVPMIEATHNARDAAMIALAFDLGPRGGEFESMTVGDITDGDHGLRVTVSGKQGKRTATIIPAVTYVNQWLSKHPKPDNPNAPLWSKLSKPESVSYQMLNKVLVEAAARANDIDRTDGDGEKRPLSELRDQLPKPVTLTNFRKSSAAHLASKGVNQAHIEDHHGWVRGSRVASRYVSVFAEESDRQIAEAYGKDVEPKETDDISPIDCPRCGKETPRHKDLCVWCGQGLEPGAAEKADQVDDIMVKAIAESDSDRANELLDMREDVKEDPALLAELMEDLEQHLDGE